MSHITVFNVESNCDEDITIKLTMIQELMNMNEIGIDIDFTDVEDT
ncbi:hypothetical protein [Neobacillus sp. LXY-4]